MVQSATVDAEAPIGHLMAEHAALGHLEYVDTLSLREQFRLVEIAHESSDRAIREAALAILHKYLHPLMMTARSHG